MAVSHKCRPAKLERSLLPNCDGERRSTIELLPPRTAGQKLNLSALKGEVLRRSQDNTLPPTPDFPRCCVNDPFGLIYNLTAEDGSPQERRTPTSHSAGHGVRAGRRRQPFFQTLFGSSLVAARCGYRGRPVCVAQLPALFPILGESGKVSSFVDAMPFGVQLDFAP